MESARFIKRAMIVVIQLVMHALAVSIVRKEFPDTDTAVEALAAFLSDDQVNVLRELNVVANAARHAIYLMESPRVIVKCQEVEKNGE